jgi:bifunctional UDP-N-acetylglucosamine pyrophosphorylase / glucosamine-1-phosphate N-acetyltransferase
MDVSVVILAAGQGKRMNSDLPKVLQPLAGRPLLAHVIDTVNTLCPDKICVVYGHGGDLVKAAFADQDLSWVLQAEQLGTGHAVMQAMPDIGANDIVLILCGDVPLVRAKTIEPLLAVAQSDKLAILTTNLAEPAGYGRIVRDIESHVVAIVEEKDATNDQKSIKEINTGLMACRAPLLSQWLKQISPDNAQGEYYLTDIVGCAIADGVAVIPVSADQSAEVLGINDKRQLAEAERNYQLAVVDGLLQQGVTIIDPQRVDVRGNLTCGRDVIIDINTIFEGDVVLSDGVQVGANTVISNSSIGAGTSILPNCILDQARVGALCEIGPFARTRPGVEMADQAKLGNFVEIKKSFIGKGSKVNHLTYIGDATIGERVNVGAGTITCNYDGANKHPTTIGDGAFIGSGVELVAPISIGEGATIGAGATVSRDAPAGELTVERVRQKVVKGWQRPTKVKS